MHLLTRKAIFLSLFIAENCFRRDNTAESRGLSGAIVSSTIHGWPGINGNHHRVVRNISSKFPRNSFFFWINPSNSLLCVGTDIWEGGLGFGFYINGEDECKHCV